MIWVRCTRAMVVSQSQGAVISENGGLTLQGCSLYPPQQGDEVVGEARG